MSRDWQKDKDYLDKTVTYGAFSIAEHWHEEAVAEKERADKLHNAINTCLTAGNSLASLIMGYDLPEGHEEWTHQNANSYFFGQFYNDRQTAYERYETWLAWKSIKDVALSLYPKGETKPAVLEEEEA